MNAVKKTILLHNMLLLLTENEYISVSKMASILGTSESTIRRNLDELDFMIRDSGYGSILKIPGKGLHLQVNENGTRNITMLFSKYEVQNITTDEQQVYKYLLTILTSKAEKFTLYQLSEAVYDSIPVVRKKLESCEEWLNCFDLHLNIKRNYGISLEGKEENYRLAIRQLVIHNNIYSVEEGVKRFTKGLDIALLKKCISAIEQEWNFKFTEESFYSVLIFAALSITRSDKNGLSLSEAEREIVYKYSEYHWAKSLFEQIDESFHVKTYEDEIIFLATQLLCSGLIHDQQPGERQVYQYDAKMKEFVTRIITTVSEVTGVDLTQDQELYYGLLNHIRPAIFRMRFDKHSSDTLIDYIKEEYRETYRVSWALSILFEEYYGLNISSAELSYITLYIQSAMERVQRPVNLALVTDLSMGLNQMFCSKIKLAIPRVEHIAIISLREFRASMIEKFDLIVTTSPINVQSEKIVQVSTLLNETGIDQISKWIKKLEKTKLRVANRFDVVCHSLFDPRLIFPHVQVKNKNELLAFLTGELTQYGYVTEKYLNTILKREETVSTYIGNGVAIPHGNAAFVNDSKVAVAFLDEEIVWNEEEQEKVNSVFLLAFRIENLDNSKQVQLFYRIFLELIKTDESIKGLRNMSSQELYKYFVR